MRAFREIVRSGLDGLVLHPLRAWVTVLAVLAPLVPYLVAVSISRGIEQEAAVSLAEGGDLFLTGMRFGSAAPLPAAYAAKLLHVPGVVSVTPRVVGSVFLGSEGEAAVLVGVPATHMPGSAAWLRGRFPRPAAANELAIGAELARRLHLALGDTLPPFYHSRSGDRLSVIVGIFRPEAPIWSARLILTPLETAQQVFDRPGEITDLQVRCKPGSADEVAAAVQSHQSEWAGGPSGLRITFRDQLRALLEQSSLHREGLFHLHWVLALAVAIGVVLVTSGVGLGERTREIGLLKATGWGTDEVLLRSLAESLSLCAAAWALGIGLALVWLGPLNGWGIAPLFISGLDPGSPVRIPYAISPFAAGSAGLIAFGVVLSGTLYSAWRAAVTEPLTALRQ